MSHILQSPETLLPDRPPERELLKKIDEDRYRRGMPNVFDVG